MKCQSAAQYFVLVVSITTKRVVQSEKKKPYKLGRDFTVLQGRFSSLERKCLSNYMAALQEQSYYCTTELSVTC